MKLIKSFLTLLLFAVCAAFSFPVKANPKPVIVPMKAEKITPTVTRQAATVNFVRTDSLVMYEAAQLPSDIFSMRRAYVVINQDYAVARVGISRFFRFKPEFYRRVEFVLA